MTRRPVIRRAAFYDFMPQCPDWFCDLVHINAKWRFLRKLRSQYHHETLSACPYCRHRDFILLATQERSGLPTSVMMCRECTLIFTNPRLDAASWGDHYARDYREIERGAIPDIHSFMFNLQKNKATPLASLLTEAKVPLFEGARVADIGCGEGGLIAGLSQEQHGLKATGYELNRAATAYGRSLGLDVRTEYFDGTAPPFDFVIVEQTLEHLSDPGALLSAIAQNQKPGGVLYIGVPGVLAYPANYDNNFLQYLQYGHLFHYTLQTLERLVIPHGYRLAHGNETIRAVFVRTDTVDNHSTRATVHTANEIVAIMNKAEGDFRARGSHLLRNWKNYLRYGLRWALSAISPFKHRT